MWGDEQVLCLCSMMLQIGLTVMSAETFTQIRFRHRSSLEKADGVLVMCLGQHYVPACKYSLFVPLIQSPFQVIRFIFISSNVVGCSRTDPYCGQTVAFCGQMVKLLFLLISSILCLFQCVALMKWMHRATS